MISVPPLVRDAVPDVGPLVRTPSVSNRVYPSVPCQAKRAGRERRVGAESGRNGLQVAGGDHEQEGECGWLERKVTRCINTGNLQLAHKMRFVACMHGQARVSQTKQNCNVRLSQMSIKVLMDRDRRAVGAETGDSAAFSFFLSTAF